MYYVCTYVRTYECINVCERKLKEPEVKEKYQIAITNRFAALENLNVDKDVYRVWENIRANAKPQLKRAWVCTNGSSINHGLKKNV